MPDIKTMLQMAAVTLATIAVANNVPAIGKLLRG